MFAVEQFYSSDDSAATTEAFVDSALCKKTALEGGFFEAHLSSDLLPRVELARLPLPSLLALPAGAEAGGHSQPLPPRTP